MIGYRSIPRIGIIVLLISMPVMARGAQSDVRWGQAATMESEGRYDAAAAQYAAILADYPNSQRAAMRIAMALRRAGCINEARTSHERAHAINPAGYWAEVGLYERAVLERNAGEAADSMRYIELLQAQFPDSPSTAKAAVLATELSGGNVDAARTALNAELAAFRRIDQARQADEQEQLALLDQVITEHPQHRASLRALDAKGHLLSRMRRRSEAMGVFEEIIQRAGESAPQSRVVQMAKTRLGMLMHKAGRKADALAVFIDLAENGTLPEAVSNATLQVAAIEYELLQRKAWARETVSVGEWQEVRRKCAKVRTLAFATSDETARAELMTAEVLLWEGRTTQALAGADHILAAYDVESHRQVVATAHLVAGECRQRQGEYDAALRHYRWIASEFDEEEVWPGLKHTQRAYFNIYRVALESRASEDEILRAGNFVLDRWPRSPYGWLVRKSLRERGHEILTSPQG